MRRRSQISKGIGLFRRKIALVVSGISTSHSFFREASVWGKVVGGGGCFIFVL